MDDLSLAVCPLIGLQTSSILSSNGPLKHTSVVYMCRIAAPVFLDILIATSSKIWSRFWLRGDLSKNLYGVREFPFAYTLNVTSGEKYLLPVQYPDENFTYMTFFWFKSLNSWNRLWATTGLSAFWKMLFRWNFIKIMRWRKMISQTKWLIVLSE